MTQPKLSSLAEDFALIGLVRDDERVQRIVNPPPSAPIVEDSTRQEDPHPAEVVDLDVARVAAEISRLLDQADLDDDQLADLSEQAARIMRQERGAEIRRERRLARRKYRRVKAVKKRMVKKWRRSAAGRRFKRLYKRAQSRLGHLRKSGVKRITLRRPSPAQEGVEADALTALIADLNDLMEAAGKVSLAPKVLENTQAFASLSLAANDLAHQLVPVEETLAEMVEADLFDEEGDDEIREGVIEFCQAVNALAETAADYAETLHEYELGDTDAAEFEEDFKLFFSTFLEMLEIYDDLIEDVSLFADSEEEDQVEGSDLAVIALAASALEGLSDDDALALMKGVAVKLESLSDDDIPAYVRGLKNKLVGMATMSEDDTLDAVQGMVEMGVKLANMPGDEAMKVVKGMKAAKKNGYKKESIDDNDITFLAACYEHLLPEEAVMEAEKAPFGLKGRSDPWNSETGKGGRFAALAKELEKRPDIQDPKAVAAAIGQKKYGAKKMAQWAAKEKGKPGPQ